MKAGERSTGCLGCLGVVFALLVLCLGASGGEAEARPRVLLSAVPGGMAVERGHRPTEKRKRRVNVDFSALAGADEPEGAASVSLNLFPDVDITALRTRFERHGGQRFAWYGKVQNDPMSMVVLTTEDDLMSGLVFAHGRHYSIQGASASTQEVVEVDQSAFPPEGCDQIPAGNQAQLETQPTAAPGILADSGASIDVLVLHTPAARIDAGGSAAIRLLAQQSINVTNTTYTNSGIVTRLNLVHAAEVAYTESPDNPAGWSQDLNLLAGNGDGSMDEIHALRDFYGADVVVLLVRDSVVYCGLADAVMANASTAFVLVAQECATFEYTLGHEIGHLQGARHDLYVDPTLGSPYDYNHGRVSTALRRRTVMAYNDLCADTPPGTYCERVPYWSNPDVNYPSSSVPTGTLARENNALVLNTTAATVANFRQETFELFIQSTNPAAGVTIAVSPAGVRGLTNGSTPFIRTYVSGSTITLTAPSLGGGNVFGSWTGCTATGGANGQVCTVTLGADRTVTANYALALTVMSSYPAVGVPVTVSPLDVGGFGDGTSPFVRSYTPGTTVTLTASSLAFDGNPFDAWTGCTATSGTFGEVCTVTMDASRTVIANYARDLGSRPVATILWSNSETGQAMLRQLDPDTKVLQNSIWLYSPAGVGAPWKATSYTPVDATTAYVLWTRSDRGSAVLWRIDPSQATGIPFVVPVIPIASLAHLYSAAGVGGPWQATSYAQVSATEAHVLWTRSDIGAAVLWKINPGDVTGTIPVVSLAHLYSAAGVGGPWQATSYARVSATEAHVLWTRGDIGAAVLWKINPGDVTGTIPIVSLAHLYSAGGVGGPWQAAGYEPVSATTAAVLWTRGDTGQGNVWNITPGGVAGTIPVDSQFPIDAASGYPSSLVVGPWQATSFVPSNTAPTLTALPPLPPIDEDAGQQTVGLSGISAGGLESQTLSVTAVSSNTALIPNPTVNYSSPSTTGSLSFTPVANASGTATITVTVNDGQSGYGLVVRTFTVTVTAVNDPPTALALGADLVDGGLPAGTTVGTLSTTDPDAGDTFVYAFASGAGDANNALFWIDGNQLKTNAVLDYNVTNPYHIRLRSTDQGGVLFTEQDFTVVPPAYALWTRSDTGQAALWQLNPATGALVSSVWISGSGITAPWQATSFAHVDGVTGYVLWTRSDTGQATLRPINPSTGVLGNPTWLYSTAGVGAPWQATSYRHVAAGEGYVLWTRSDTGQAALWRIDPTGVGTLPVIVPADLAWLSSTAGVGGPWKATSFDFVNSNEGYVLWTRADTGQAGVWRIDPSEVGILPVVMPSSSAYLLSAVGVGGPWQATGIDLVDATTGYVLWTRDDAGIAAVWRINPSAVGASAVIDVLEAYYLDSSSGVGQPWQASSYAPGAR